MNNPEVQLPQVSDHLGRMLLISMIFHVLLFVGIWFFHPKAARKNEIVPNYTVDLVNLPEAALMAEGPEGPAAKLETASPPGPPASRVEERPAEKPAAPPLAKTPVKAPPEASPIPRTPTRPVHVPVIKAKPTPPLSRPVPPAPVSHARPIPPVPKPTPPVPVSKTSVPAPAPVTPPQVKAKGLEKPSSELKKEGPQPRTHAQKSVKTTPVSRPPSPVSSTTDPKAREREIAEEIQASQQKAARGVREEAIRDSVRGLEKGLASKSRNQAYQEAVGQAAARVSAGKVSARLAGPRGGKGGSAAATGSGDKGNALSPVYGQNVARLIRGHWSPQCNPRNNLKTLKTIVVVRVAANGNIVASWFEQESGDRLYDQAAMAAVTRANPLPALPAGQTQLEIGVTFTPEWKADS